MITNCVNPSCRVPFSHAREGRIFSVDHDLERCGNRPPLHQVEQYWLCGACSQTKKVVVEDGRVVTVAIEVETASLAE
jgi:hypothetical protein